MRNKNKNNDGAKKYKTKADLEKNLEEQKKRLQELEEENEVLKNRNDGRENERDDLREEILRLTKENKDLKNKELENAHANEQKPVRF